MSPSPKSLVKVFWCSSNVHQEKTHLDKEIIWSPPRRVNSLVEATVLAGFPATQWEQIALGLSLMQSPVYSYAGCSLAEGFLPELQ